MLSPSNNLPHFFASTRKKNKGNSNYISNNNKQFNRKWSVHTEKSGGIHTVHTPTRTKKEKNARKSAFQNYFNFDGTLENRKINLPERPKTAEIGRKSSISEIKSFKKIASHCLKLKEKNSSKQELQIQPWSHKNDNRPDQNLA